MSTRKAISLEEKYEATVSYMKKEKTAKQIILELKIAQSTLSGWIKIKDQIIDQYERSRNKATVKKIKNAAHLEVEKA